MALTADQRAMVQLLLERGQSYADLASLLGIDESEVRSRARAALAELGGADPDRNVGLTDWLLGQADPIGRADAVRHLKENADDHRLAQDLLSRLAEIAPAADLPRLPGEPRGGGFLRRGAPTAAAEPKTPAAAKEPAAPSRARERLSRLTPQQTRLIAILGSAAVILLVVVLAIAGVFSGGSSDQATTTAASATQTTSTSGTDPCAGQAQTIARVPLQPVDQGDAAGLASVNIVGGGTPCLDLQVRNLEPAPNGQTYIVWFLFTPTQGYPLAPLTGIGADGSYNHSIAIPSATVSLIARAQFIEVSLAPNQTVAAAIQKARKSQQLVIDVPGQAIARGTVPKTAATNGATPGGSSGG